MSAQALRILHGGLVASLLALAGSVVAASPPREELRPSDAPDRERQAVDLLADLLKGTYEDRDPKRSAEAIHAGVRRYASLNLPGLADSRISEMADSVVAAIRGTEDGDAANPDLIRLRDPVLREALLGSIRNSPAGRLSGRALNEKARSICLSVIRLKDADATLGPADLVFADELAEEVARSHPTILRSSFRTATAEDATKSVVAGAIADRLRDVIKNSSAFRAVTEMKVNEKLIPPAQQKDQLFKNYIETEEFRTEFAKATNQPDAAIKDVDKQALGDIVDKLLARAPHSTPPPPPVGLSGPPSDDSPSPFPDGTTSVMGKAATQLGEFLRIAHNDLMNIVVNEKKLTRDQRKQQLLLFLDDEGFLEEFRDAVGKPDATPTGIDKNALEKIIDDILDQAPEKPSPGGDPGDDEAGNGKVSQEQLITVADDVSEILGVPSITQVATLATDVYTLLGRPTFSSFSLSGRPCRLFSGRRSTRFVRVYP